MCRYVCFQCVFFFNNQTEYKIEGRYFCRPMSTLMFENVRRHDGVSTATASDCHFQFVKLSYY